MGVIFKNSNNGESRDNNRGSSYTDTLARYKEARQRFNDREREENERRRQEALARQESTRNNFTNFLRNDSRDKLNSNARQRAGYQMTQEGANKYAANKEAEYQSALDDVIRKYAGKNANDVKEQMLYDSDRLENLERQARSARLVANDSNRYLSKEELQNKVDSLNREITDNKKRGEVNLERNENDIARGRIDRDIRIKDSELTEERDSAQKYLSDIERAEEKRGYEELARGLDFTARSKYDPQAEYDENDIAYRYINDVDGFRNNKANSANVTNNGTFDLIPTRDMRNYSPATTAEEKGYNLVTDDEKSIYNYLYNTRGSEEADKYLGTLNLSERRAEARKEIQSTSAKEYPVLSSAATILTAPLQGVEALGAFVDKAVTGEQVDPYSSNFDLTNYRSNTREAVQEDMGDVGRFLYGTGMSMGDFLFTNAVTGGSEALSLGIMGTSAASDSLVEAKKNGFTDEEAIALAVIAGAAEIVTEKVSIDKLFRNDSKGLKYVIENALAEGSEEVGSDLINTVANLFINNGQNELEEMVNEYVAQGYTTSEAWGKVISSKAAEMGTDFLGGFISGAVMSGSKAGLDYGTEKYVSRKENAEIAGSDKLSSVYVDYGKNSKNESTRNLAEKIEKEGASRGEMQSLIKAVDSENDTASEWKKAFIEEGLSKQEAEDLADVAMGVASEDAKKASKKNMAVLNNVKEKMLADENYKLKEDAESNLNRTRATAAQRLGLISPMAEVNADDTNTRVDQKVSAGNIKSIDRISDDGIIAVLNDGTKVNINKAQLDDANLNRVLANANNIIEAKRIFEDYRKADLPGRQFEEVYKTFYNAGRNGMRYSDIKISDAVKEYVKDGNISDEQLQTYFQLGVNKANRISAVAVSDNQKQLASKIVEAVSKNFFNGELELQFTDDSSINGKMTGNTIFISNNATDPALVVVAHELTHYIKKTNAEGYKKYEDFVIDYLKKSNKNAYDEIVTRKRNQQAYSHLSDADINEEIAAYATEEFLFDEDAVKSLVKENPSLARKIVDFLDKIVMELVKEYGGIVPRTKEARMLSDNIEAFTKARDLWMNALKGEKSETIQSSEKYSTKGIKTYKNLEKNGFDFSNSLSKQDYSRIDQMLKKDKGELSLSGEHMLLLDNKLVYNKYGKITGVITVTCDTDTDSDITGATFVLGDLVDYEKDRRKQGISFEEVARIELEIGRQYFSGSYTIRADYGSDSITDREIGVGPKREIREKLNFHFEYEQDGIGNNTASETSGKFSLKEPVEETDSLVAVHNLTEDKLLKTLKLEGIPMPSIAVTKSKMGWNNFGDISLVFGKDTIDPKNRKNKVYGADAWTPVVPSIQYDIDMTELRKLQNKVRSSLNGAAEDIRRAAEAFLNRLEYNMDSMGGIVGAVDDFANDTALMNYYLSLSGEAVEDVVKEKRTVMPEGQIEEAKRFIEEFGDKLPDIARMSGRDALAEYGDRIKKVLAEYYAEADNGNIDFGYEVVNSMKGLEIISEVRRARDYYLNGSEKVEVEKDRAATNEAIRKAVDMKEYRKWLTDAITPLVKDEGIYNGKDIFTPSGNRKSFKQTHYPVTAENIVKAMAGNDQRFDSAFFNGTRGIRAVATEDFRSISDIRKSKDKIKNISEEEFDNLTKELDDRLSSVMRGILNGTKGKFDFGDMDNLGMNILEGCEKPTKENIKNVLSRYNWKVTDEQMNELYDVVETVKAMPVMMFEAKPMRVVGFGEILNAIIPSDSSEELKNALSEKNIPYTEYTSGNEEERLSALNNTEGSKFSVKDSEGNSLSEGQQKYFADSKIRDEAGNLLLVYHGTPRGGFTVFNRDINYYTASKKYAERYLNPSASSSGVRKESSSPMVYEGYINMVKPFDVLSDKEAKRIFVEEYVKGGYALGINPYSSNKEIENYIKDGIDWNEADNLKEFFDDNDYDYDGIILNEGGDITDNGTKMRGMSYATFSSNQFKDKNNLNPTSDEDIKLSTKYSGLIDEDLDFLFDKKPSEEVSANIQTAGEILKDGIEALNKNGRTITHKSSKNIAKKYLEMYNSKYGAERLATNIDRVFAYFTENDVASYSDLVRVMKEVARPVIEKIDNRDPYLNEQYEYFRNYFAHTQMRLDEEQIKEVAYQFGSFKEFQKAAKKVGLKFVTQGGYSLDGLWEELVQSSYYILDEEISSPDEPSALIDFMEGLEPSNTVMPEQDAEEASYDLALNIIGDWFEQMGMKEQKRKMAEVEKEYREYTKKKYDERVAYLKEKNKKKYLELGKKKDDLIKKIAEARDEKEKAMEDEYKAEIKRISDKMTALRNQKNEKIAQILNEASWKRAEENDKRIKARYKKSLLKIVNELDKMNGDETDVRRIPAKLKSTVRAVCEAASMETVDSKSIAERLLKLEDAYVEATKNDDGSTDYDEGLHNLISEARKHFQNANTTELTRTQYETLLKVVKAVKHQVQVQNKLINSRIKLATYEAGKDMISEIRKGKKYSDGRIARMFNSYLTSSLNSERFFARLSNYTDDGITMKLWKELNDGQHKMLQIEQEVSDLFADVLEGEENQKNLEKLTSTKDEDMVSFVYDGRTYKVPRAMRVSMALNLLNEDNMKHIVYGGLTLPNETLYKRGDGSAFSEGTTIHFINPSVTEEYRRAMHDENLTVEQKKEAAIKYAEDMKAMHDRSLATLEDFVNGMTDYEKKVFECAKKYFHDYSGKMINETSLALNGYEKAKTEKYFPIYTDKNFTRTEVDGMKFDATPESWGNLKERIGGSNPVYLLDIFDTVKRHSTMLARYSGMAIPMRNFNKVYNVSTTSHGDSVKKAVNEVWTKRAEEYISNLFQDLVGGRKQGSAIVGKLRGNYAQAALAVNYGVTIKQAASFPTAAATVGWDALGYAMKRNGGSLLATLANPTSLKKGTKSTMELIKKWSPLVAYRNKGNSTEELSDVKKTTTLLDRVPGVNKVVDKLMNWIQNVDTATVTSLWYAAEYRVQQDTKLEKGTDEYYKAVAEVFNKCTEDTQPNYTVMQRPDIMRNPNQALKVFTMFKTQPFQNFGIMFDATNRLRIKAQEAKANPTDKAKQAALADAKQNFAKAWSSQVVAAVVFASMQLLADVIKHSMNAYRDDDKELTAEAVLKGWNKNLISTLAGSPLFGTQIFDFMYSAITKEKYWGIEDDTFSAVQNMADDVLTILNTDYDGDNAGKLAGNMAKLAADIATAFGIPVNNAKNLIMGMYYHAQDIANGEPFSFEAGVTRTAKQNTNRLIKALEEGDDEKVERILEDVNSLTGTNSIGAYVKSELKAGNIDSDEAKETMEKSGMTEAEANEYLDEEVFKDVTERLKNGSASASFAEEQFVKFGMDKNAAHWKAAKIVTGIDSDYCKLYKAIESGSGINEAVQELLKYGYTKEKLESSTAVSSRFKEAYIELYGKDKEKAARLKESLITYYSIIGKDRSKQSKLIDGWVK